MYDYVPCSSSLFQIFLFHFVTHSLSPAYSIVTPSNMLCPFAPPSSSCGLHAICYLHFVSPSVSVESVHFKFMKPSYSHVKEWPVPHSLRLESLISCPTCCPSSCSSILKKSLFPSFFLKETSLCVFCFSEIMTQYALEKDIDSGYTPKYV